MVDDEYPHVVVVVHAVDDIDHRVVVVVVREVVVWSVGVCIWQLVT